MYNNELYHFGVKGMRWGVRRYQNKDGSLTNAGKRRYENDKNNQVKDMSDAELRQKINRLQMERQYEKLNEKKISAGKKFVTGILLGAATSVASSYANKYMGKAAEWMGGKVVKGAGKGLDIVVDNIPMNIILDNLTD